MRSAVLLFILASSVLLFADAIRGNTLLRDLQCHFQNKSYEMGARFVDNSCNRWCRCTGRGRLQCFPLCPPPSRPICDPDSVLVAKEVPSPDPEGRCKCKMSICVPRPPPPDRGCHFEGKSYKRGERFIDGSCLGWCRCRAHGWIGCVSLCPPMGIMCPPGRVKQTYQHPMDQERRCFCKREMCKEKVNV